MNAEKLNLKIEWFCVGEDIQIQIDHENPNWYDEFGKLKIEYLFDELGNGELIEVNEINSTSGSSLWCSNNKLYSWNNTDVANMKKTGVSRMYYLDELKNFIDQEVDSDIDFIKWWFSVETKEEALMLLQET